jgi:signal transduction histidine kinase
MKLKRLYGSGHRFAAKPPRFIARSRRVAVRGAHGLSIATAVAQFAVTGLAAVALLGFVAVQVLQHTGRTEAIRDAKRETVLAGRGIVAPAITNGLLGGLPSAISQMDRVVRRYVLRDPVVRIKIWNASGRILYSDEHRLIGTSYNLGSDERRALMIGGVDAEVSDLPRPENRFERSQHKLLEVYLGITDPSGRKLLFEDYLRYSSVAASGRRLWRSFAPALIVTLALLELAQIPLAWSMARRLRRGQAAREALLRRSIEASEVERRRIARDLHDGAVQNLAGVSYSLSAAADAIARGDASAVKTVRSAASDTRQSIRELRTLLVDIYPPNLSRAGLAAALSDLVASLPAGGLEIQLEVQSDLRLPAHAEPLLYRAAQEALRNVVAHAEARHVRVAAGRRDGKAFLSVADDGRGDSRRARMTAVSVAGISACASCRTWPLTQLASWPSNRSLGRAHTCGSRSRCDGRPRCNQRSVGRGSSDRAPGS